jgi:hypothetical protein
VHAGIQWVAHSAGPIRAVGYHALDGRPAFKLALHVVDGHWILYLGHLWDSSWSIVDVTDPEKPRLVEFIKEPPNTWTLQVAVHASVLATDWSRSRQAGAVIPLVRSERAFNCGT